MYAFGSMWANRYNYKPFAGQQWTGDQELYFRDNPSAAVEALLGMIPQSGPQAASRDFMGAARSMLNQRLQSYQGAVAMNPTLKITDYLNDFDLGGQYALSQPYRRPPFRRTRTLRSF